MSESVTTVADLHALPVGSVVRTEDAQIYLRTPGGWDCLSEDGTGGTYESSTVLFQTLPPSVLVLYRPEPPDAGA